MKSTILDSEKAVNVVLYLAKRLPEEGNEYKILKAIYLANKTHLTKYGREIFNETYQALEWGAVPALAYDIVKHIQTGKPQPDMPENVRDKINVSKNNTITALVKHDPKALSESDIECLEEAIKFYLNMSFKDVADNAHEDAAYQGTPRNAYIPIEKIIQTLPEGERILKHLKVA